ncbi:MAG: PAS domain S-box protein, partial [Elusimicrobia bacterium]|nr:PAS domain S-box protein [Elusimicrobiota bacterium]
TAGALMLLLIRRREEELAAEAADRGRLMDTLVQCTRAVAHAETRQGLFEEVCRLIVERGELAAAAAWAPDGTGALRPAAACGLGAEELLKLRLPLGKDAPRSAAVAAFATGAPVSVPDIWTDPRTSDMAAFARRVGHRSLCAHPLREEGEPVGVLVVLWSKPARFSQEGCALLGALASDVGYALDNLVLEEKAADSAKALHESRHLLSEITESLPMLLFILDVRSRTLVYASRRVENQLGYTREELLAMVAGALPTFIHPEDLELVERAVAATAADGRPREATHRSRHKDGSWRWQKVLFSVFSRSPTGEPERLLGVVEDVTSHVEGERALARLTAQYRRVAQAAESAAESIVITDPKGIIQYVNPAFERVSGYCADEVLTRHTRMLKSGRQDEGYYKQLWTAITAGRTWHGHFVNKRKDGTLYEEEVSISPVRDDHGVITNFVAVKRDVTKEVSLETQLQQAQKLEAVGRLAGGVAHDFNNILTSIIGFTQMVRETLPAGSQERSDLEEVEKGARRAADLTRQLLIFSRKQVVQPRLIDPAASVAGLQQMLRRIIGESYSLRAVFETAGTAVMADPSQFEQVLMNFVVNARDAMPDGGEIELSVRDAVVSEPLRGLDGPVPPGRYVAVAVKDAGCGIPADVLPRVCEPFFTTKPPGQGTGLGLATVYGIIKRAGATLKVDTAVGAGTAMTVYWPASAEPYSEEAAVDAAPRAAAGGGESVLLVEDEEAVRRLAARILTEAGYRVDARREAPPDAEADGFDLLVTDITLPGGRSGLELAAALRGRAPSRRVLLMTGHSEALVSGAEGWRLLQKPFSRESLLAAVRGALEEPLSEA